MMGARLGITEKTESIVKTAAGRLASHSSFFPFQLLAYLAISNNTMCINLIQSFPKFGTLDRMTWVHFLLKMQFNYFSLSSWISKQF